MVQGLELASEEKEYIITNKEKKFPSTIAKELSERFPLQNGGYRSTETVRKFMRD